jgi:hypothetical protein
MEVTPMPRLWTAMDKLMHEISLYLEIIDIARNPITVPIVEKLRPYTLKS